MIHVQSVKVVSEKSITLKVGQWYYGAEAQVCPSNADIQEVEWCSDNTSVATVNAASGYIFACGPGEATIYAKVYDNGYKCDCLTVKVTDGIVYATSVEMSRTSIVLQKGEEFKLCATVNPETATNRNVEWTSSNSSVASVSDGVVTANAVGEACIIAEAQDGSGKRAVCSVEVSGNILVTSVSVDPQDLYMRVGQSEQLCEDVLPGDATKKCVKWSSDNTSVAVVNPDSGMVYAKSAGIAIICATSKDGTEKKGYCTVRVRDTIYVNQIDVSESAVEIVKNKTKRLTAVPCPENADNRTVRWYSEHPKIVTVDEITGVITARSAGKGAVYAKSQDGGNVTGYCCVTVKENGPCPNEEKAVPPPPEGFVADPVDAFSGAHTLQNTIMTLYGGQGIKLVLNYDSTRLSSGVFGTGWYHNYEKHLEISGDEVRVYSSPSAYSRYCANSDHTVFTCTVPSKNGYIIRLVNDSVVYRYVLDCNSDHTEYYDFCGCLRKIVDHQGFETLIDYEDSTIIITDTVSGRKIYLEKDSTGKVVRAYDEASRQATFNYSGGLLTGICDLNQNNMTYTYNEEGQVLTGVDSNGTCYFTNTYDGCGRVETQQDGAHHQGYTNFVYINEENENPTRITTDRKGDYSTRIFDENGLLISYTDENGNEKTYTYDDRYNIIKETDANGNSVTKVYNSFNKPAEITDKNGNTTYISYDNKGNVTKIKYPAINGVTPEETFSYNDRNQLTQHIDKRGTVTTYTYDASSMPLTKKVGSKNAIQYSYQNGLLTSVTDALGHTTQYGHNAIGQVTTMTDAENNVTLYEYDAFGNMLKTTDPFGKTTVNTYDGNHQKTSVTDANGNKTEYLYDGNMNNYMVILPDGNSIVYEYDVVDRRTSELDQERSMTATRYDKVGRVISKIFRDGSTVRYEHDKVGNVIKETNPKGAVTTKTYDAQGNVLTSTDEYGNVTRYQYNAMGKVVRAVNAVSGSTIYEYSKAGDLLSETDALGNKKTYTYDNFGNKLTATDALGNTTVYTYDANDNLLTVRDALGNTTTYTYNSVNQLVSVKDAKNNTVRYAYDALGRRTTITDAKNNVFTTVYDANGNVLKTLDAKGNTVSETVYNCLNLPATVTDSTGKTTTYTYNTLGKMATSTDSMNHRQEYTYDPCGRVTSVMDANNSLSSAQYDEFGNITTLSGPIGITVRYTYDNLGRLTSESTASGGLLSYQYNELNIKKELTNAREQVRKYFYDAAGRITGYVGAEDSVSYTYDANGNVLTVADSNGTVRREYDALNRVKKYTDTFGKSICYEYDAVGNLTRLVYPDNSSVNYTYDANNNLVSVTDWQGRATHYTYDVNNRVIGVTKPDGSVTTTVYDNKQRIVSTVEKMSNGTVITGFEYTYDSLSRIVEEKDLAENKKLCYTYDSLNRVISRTVKSEYDIVLSSENYSYDAAGNILEAPNSLFNYDVNNRLVDFNGKSVTYDMDGNMLSDGVTAFEYDSANRLIKSGDNTYTYNAEDVRIRNLCSDADTTYTYNTNCKLSQLLQKTTNGTTTKYVYGLGLIGEEENGTFKTYHFDYRGSTIAITNTAGEITDTFKYDTYGKVIERTGESVVIFGYNGRDGVVTDSNGLIYMRARYYSPEMRRFINADILHGEITDSTSLNRYSYVNGNPVSFVDPFGLEKQRGGGKPFSGNFYTETTSHFGVAQTLTEEQYNQILASSFNGKLKLYFAPNQKGYSEILAFCDSANEQVFSMTKYRKRSLFTPESYTTVSYHFVTLTVSEWKNQVVVADYYDEKFSSAISFGISFSGAWYDDVNGGQLGEAVSMLYDKFDEHFLQDLQHVIPDDRSRYIYKNIIGKDDSEKVSILMKASLSGMEKNYFTGKWKEQEYMYAVPWSDEIELIY